MKVVKGNYLVHLLFMTVAFYILWMMPMIDQAQAANGVVTASVANIRSAPSTQSGIVGTVYKDTSVTTLSKSGEWYKVQYGNVTGWMNQSVLTEKSVAIAEMTPKVTLDGQPMSFDVPPITVNDRIMVPMAAIFRAMGATVEWNEATQTVTATRGTTQIILPIGSTYPVVNGAVWKLDVPARVVNNRTLAPLRFVGEALGGTVNWDEASYTAIMTSPPQNGAKVVAVSTGSSTVNLRGGPGTSYNVVDTAPPGETLTVMSEQGGWYQVSRGSTNGWVAGWVVALIRADEGTPPPVVDPGTPPPASGSGSMTLTSERTIDGVKIFMESTEKLDTSKTTSSSQIIYTYDDMQISGTTSLKEYLGPAVLTAQGTNSGNKAMVAINFPAGVEYKTATENNGKREVFFIPNYISTVSRKTFGTSGENITVNTVTSMKYTSTTASNRLEVVFDNVLIGSASGSSNIKSPLISSMVFKTKGNGTVLTITTTKAAKFSIGPNSDGSALNIMFIDQSELQNRVPIVVLDAGHGGNDPGASGTSLCEKEVNLAVVKKVGQLLTAKGIKVVYTRSDDTYVSLDDRTNIANLYNAAVFVSVHCNANTSSAPSGTETYCYYPQENPQLYMQKDERYNLALRLQQAMVAGVGRIDRGVKQGNLAVLRESMMPSALVEMAFISNPTEEALLKQQQFRDQAAKAIADAIAGYMNVSANPNNIRP